jgi:hypothetical protein
LHLPLLAAWMAGYLGSYYALQAVKTRRLRRFRVQHGEPGLAVVDSDGGFHGLIPPQRLLGVLLAEHHEDLARSAVSCVPPPPPGGASVESGCAHSHALR